MNCAKPQHAAKILPSLVFGGPPNEAISLTVDQFPRSHKHTTPVLCSFLDGLSLHLLQSGECSREAFPQHAGSVHLHIVGCHNTLKYVKSIINSSPQDVYNYVMCQLRQIRGRKAKAQQTSQLHPPGQLFFIPRKKEELPWVGFEPTTLCCPRERSICMYKPHGASTYRTATQHYTSNSL